MRTEVENRVRMTKALVSARRAASSDDRYAPLRDGTFKVSTVELPKQLVDEDACFVEDDIDRVHVGTVAEISEVGELVRGVRRRSGNLGPPWKNHFPL